MAVGLEASGTEGQAWVSPPGSKEVPPPCRAGLGPSGCRRAERAGLYAGWGEGLVSNKREVL